MAKAQDTNRPKGDDDEPMPFDDALRILLAAPPQHKMAKAGNAATPPVRNTPSKAQKPKSK